MEQPELHSLPQHLHVGTAKLAGQAPGWLFQGETPIWEETESFSLLFCNSLPGKVEQTLNTHQQKTPKQTNQTKKQNRKEVEHGMAVTIKQ